VFGLAGMVPTLQVCDDRGVRRTVLIVDDHARFRESAAALLEAEGLTVIGEAADGASALAQVARLRPDVVVLDVQLPDLDGFEVAERLASSLHPPQVVLISSREPGAYGGRVAAARVRGFVSKDELSGAAVTMLLE
jgi:DNA-binding NarL/FixJ family response regulator